MQGKELHSIIRRLCQSINPRQTKHFDDAMGKLAKTDKADALMLAKFASLMKPKYTVNKDQAVEELGDLLSASLQTI